MQPLSVNHSFPPPYPANVARTGSKRDFQAGSSQPTLDVIRKLATALSVSSGRLLFGKDERGPDDDLHLQFEAISRFDDEEKRVAGPCWKA